MKKFDGILMCTDLDGTLLNRSGAISEENKAAIEYFKSEGGRFTFITGRMPAFSGEFCELVNPNAPYGCINGGGLYDHKAQEYLWTQELSRRALTLMEYVDKQLPSIGFQLNTKENIYFCKDTEAMVWFREVTGLPLVSCHYNDVKEPILKVVFADLDENKIEALIKLLDSHPMAEEFDFVRSEKNLYEILPKGIGKAVALKKLCELLSLDIKRTIAVGDYNNDISMLRAAGVGFAVSNACPDALAAADRITVSNDEHAIAKIIDDLDRGAIF